ncbi:Uncharacterised protein [Klebsiella pneumoniae]|uniref:Uncharacterized protein n=1 Tax=Klebsiella pneumoniae TaxID=573 RepID=A0A377WH07_KLEPN|nr:Uncharacterised protein [Klebsiella pneumoniae]
MIKPCGVCIQLLEARIQKVETNVPSATMQVVKKCSAGGTLFQPKQHHPEESRFKEEGGQHFVQQQRGPVILPANWENPLQLVPN